MRLEVDIRLDRPDGGLTAAFRIDGPRGVITGPSGVGKTTLLHLIAGLRRPDRGRIRLDGVTLFDAEARIDAPAERRAVACLFQDDRLFPHMDVAANLRFGARTPGESGAAFARIVEGLELEALLRRRPGQLSGGEKRRVALGRVLLQRPARLLILDEPLTGLDSARRDAALRLIDERCDQADCGLLYVTHRASEKARLGGVSVVCELDDRGFAHAQLRQDGRALVEAG